jgi:alpha-L-rhamnosidase
MPGWAAPGFADSSWPAAHVVAAPAGALCAQRSEPIRVTGTLKPISVKEISPGVFIYDMGQNMVGWCRLTVNGPAGAHVTLRFAERLHDDGTLSTENLRSAQATDHYTLKGDGPESWEPRFTYHGFRYVEVTGFPGRPPLDALEGHVVNDDLAPAGDFACSDPTINQIYHNILWGVRSNYRSIATDCPQRDERQGWLGDRASTCRSESFLWLNGDFYAKWLQDIMDDERDDGAIPDVAPTYWSRYNDDVTWATTLITIPENLLDQFGDTATLAHAYPAMVKFIDHMETLVTPDGLLPIDKYGDWCMPPTDPKIIHDRSPALNTDGRISSTTYLYHCLQLMSRYAKLLNKPDDGARFDALAAKLKDGLNNQLYNRDLGQYDNGAQTATILPLAFGMVPDDQRQRVVDHLVQKITVEAHGHIGTGVLGSGWINEVLNDNGHGDIAYAMATTHTYPSFGYEIDHGATTVWELWNGDTADPSMNSGNHVMLIGDTGVWMFEDLAGIKSDPDQPGYKNILMRPTPVGNLTFVKASHQSPYGLIESEWHLDGGNFRWHITVPPNSTATVFVPTNAPDSVQENGQNAAASPGVTFLRAEPGHAVYQVQSGQYDFTAKNG